MDSELIFIVADSLKSVTKAAGMPAIAGEIPPCPLQVGDVISHPTSRGLYLRVVSRWFRAAGPAQPARWYLTLEQAPSPLGDPDPPAA